MQPFHAASDSRPRVFVPGGFTALELVKKSQRNHNLRFTHIGNSACTLRGAFSIKEFVA